MSKILDAFNSGITIAKQMERNRCEINETLKDVFQQILNATDGRLQLSLYADRSSVFKKEYITANNPLVDSPFKVICEWLPDSQNGYPLKITMEHETWHCSTKEEIEDSLADIFARPSVALRFLDLINIEQTQA
ncbi:hypothetical protein EA797_04405 [Stutzerimonas zhaodongensis]|uniref:Uncharacterized protein n=1 Tax=Stutzerimonas zhaodongensis TaxID=1176257 RepID=A0A3M2HWE4_9GAMM|nr:hypothetical protein [Stutzerimonas zhaodongensis]MCQ4314461.1 hypothetical protein [Stutzerimonas zhaodongensis]RMH91980.1 hypothetical protein EA797_04405 [Stutzerimonas zhaodongensis]